MSGEIGCGWVYTIHLTRPLGDPMRPRMSALHYTGWASDTGLLARLREHRAGTGARIMAAAELAGIRWHVGALQRGSRTDERRLKQHGAARRCWTCRAFEEGACLERAALERML